MIDNGFNVQDRFKLLSFEELKNEQNRRTYPYSIAAFNFDGSLNLGVLMRTSVIFGARNFYIIGKKRYDRRSTVGAQNYINIQHIEYDFEKDDISNVENELSSHRIVCVEQNGYDLYKYEIGNITDIDWKPTCFIFGSESAGISSKLLSKYEIMSIPQIGIMRCLNVGSCGAIVAHHVYRKWIGNKG